MANTTDVAHGTTVTHGNLTGTPHLISFRWTGIGLNQYETTHMGTTGAKTFAPCDLYDAGEIELVVEHGNDDAVAIPNATASALAITIAGVTAVSVSAFLISNEISGESEDRMLSTLRFKVTGPIPAAA